LIVSKLILVKDMAFSSQRNFRKKIDRVTIGLNRILAVAFVFGKKNGQEPLTYLKKLSSCSIVHLRDQVRTFFPCFFLEQREEFWDKMQVVSVSVR